MYYNLPYVKHVSSFKQLQLNFLKSNHLIINPNYLTSLKKESLYIYISFSSCNRSCRFVSLKENV